MASEDQEVELELRESYEAIVSLSKTDKRKAVEQFKALLVFDKDDAVLSRVQEWTIFRLADIYAELLETKELSNLLSQLRPIFGGLPKAKTAKIVRVVIDSMAKIPNSEDTQLELCKEYIEWASSQKRAFLRQRIQSRLANLYLSLKKYQAALRLLSSLQLELKKLDDKQLLVEIFLLESRVHHALRNLPRARASLTAARSLSNSIYVGTLVQGEIDLQNGILNADEKDFRTAYSYFFEAFEGLHSLGDSRSIQCLKYMLLSKIMNDEGDEVPGILNSKSALNYSGDEIDFMREVAKAYKERSLHKFTEILQRYDDMLTGDGLVARHLKDLQAKLLTHNLIRLIEPFSRVEISHIAKLIDLPLPFVETKLSQMILDRKFRGIIDQGTGELVVFDDPSPNTTYQASIKLLEDMGHVVDSLLRRAERLHH